MIFLLQGSVYQKVKPQVEIKPAIREKFWEKNEVGKLKQCLSVVQQIDIGFACQLCTKTIIVTTFVGYNDVFGGFITQSTGAGSISRTIYHLSTYSR